MAEIESESSKAETRQRLLDAAGQVFAEVGYQKATIRDICQRAGANLAAVNYHFRDKEGLYVAVAHYAQNCAAPQGLPSEIDVNAPPEKLLRMFVGTFLQRAMGRDRVAWYGKLMAREMSEPTGMLDRIIDEEIRPRAAILEGLVTRLIGPGHTQWRIRACMRSVVAQCVYYHLCRPVIERLHPEQKYEPADMEMLADHITAFALHGIRGLANEKDPA